jgi:hypothetical protein
MHFVLIVLGQWLVGWRHSWIHSSYCVYFCTNKLLVNFGISMQLPSYVLSFFQGWKFFTFVDLDTLNAIWIMIDSNICVLHWFKWNHDVSGIKMCITQERTLLTLLICSNVATNLRTTERLYPNLFHYSVTFTNTYFPTVYTPFSLLLGHALAYILLFTIFLSIKNRIKKMSFPSILFIIY